MGLDLWFQADVIRILLALASAGSERHPAYQEALHDVGLAFGVNVTVLTGETNHRTTVIVSNDMLTALSNGSRGKATQARE
jgi:hypothetical protein